MNSTDDAKWRGDFYGTTKSTTSGGRSKINRSDVNEKEEETGFVIFSKKNVSVVVSVLFSIFTFVGLMEINNPNYLQPYLNRNYDGLLKNSPVSEQDHIKTIIDPQTQVPPDYKESYVKIFDEFKFEQFFGSYTFPKKYCVVFSNKNLASSGPEVNNKQFCIKDEVIDNEAVDTEVLIDRTMMEELGLFDTVSGTEEKMRYIASGPLTWLVMTVSHIKDPYIVKPQSNINLADNKDDVDGLITSIRIRTGVTIIEALRGPVNKKTLNRNCFVVYGKDPYSNDNAKGLVFCSKWVTGDEPLVRFEHDDMMDAGVDLTQDLDGGVAYIIVGAGISTLHAYTSKDASGDCLDVQRSTVHDLNEENDKNDLYKNNVRSFCMEFGY